MSDSIRKAWLLEYLVAFAEQHGGQLSSLQPKKGKIQIINFRTLPESLEEWVWADVSDKTHFVTVRFTMEAVKSFNSDLRNAGRRLTSRRWGVATIRCSRPFLCQPPTENGKGLEDESTIALVVDQVEVAGSEGEAMFGDPRCVTKEEPMRRWLEGLRQGSGGNVLQLERLHRDTKEKETKRSIVKENLAAPPRVDTMFKSDVHSSKSNGKAVTDRQRHKQWMSKAKGLGLVAAYDHYKIPKDQRQMVEKLAVFGQDLPPSAQQSPTSKHESLAQQITPIPLEHRPSSPTSRHIHQNSPSTPSHWSASQGTNLGHDREGDDSESILSKLLSSPLKQADFTSQQVGEEEGESVARQETPSTGHRKEAQVHEQVEDASVFGEQRLLLSNPTLPPKAIIQRAEHQRHRSPSLARVYNPVVLVPDSDISGSHSQSRSYSQSLSLTQPSISQHSIPSQLNHQGKTTPKIIPESSHPKTPPMLTELSATEELDVAQTQGSNTTDPKENQLDTDDEAAQRILVSDSTKTGHSPCNPRIDAPRKPDPVNLIHPVVAVGHDGMKQGSSLSNDPLRKSDEHALALAANSHAAAASRGRKRKLAVSSATVPPEEHDEEVEPSTKRQKGSPTDEVVIERVGHDAIAWKEPSFARLRPNLKATRREPVPHMMMNHAGLSLPGQANPSPRITEPRIQVDATRPDRPDYNSNRGIHRSSDAVNSQDDTYKQTRLKLGGWQPRKDLPNESGVMTWEKFNAMLLTVGRLREQMNKPTTGAR